MKKIKGKVIISVVIIVLLTAILLAVTNPDRDRHIQVIIDSLSEKDAVSNVINLGLLAVNPPAYTSYALFSMTEYRDKTASVGLLGYVWVNEKVFR